MKKIRDFVVCSMPGERLGYFGWPSITKLGDGTLLVGASGLRAGHICPWGRTTLCKSTDGGQTWTPPLVINNTAMDDRDAGLVSLGGQRVAVTWFTSNTWQYMKQFKDETTGKWDDAHAVMGSVIDSWTDEMVEQLLGSWIRISEDGGDAWGEMRRAPVNTPHGFIVLKDGSWLYLGKTWKFPLNGKKTSYGHVTAIVAARSVDEGRTWEQLGGVPVPEGIQDNQCHEPHVVELADGTLLGVVRVHAPFNTYVTRSTDGGRTWSVMEDVGMDGSPGHLLLHSSGAVVCVYGYRKPPFGQRAKISHDGGKTWGEEIVLRDDGPSGDLGYPASVELPDGSIMTIYYQALKAGEHCSVLGTVWEL